MPNDDLHRFSGRLIAVSAKAWLVAIGRVECWLPKSQCELDDPHADSGEQVSGTIPGWLVQKEGIDLDAEPDLIGELEEEEDVPTHPIPPIDRDDDYTFEETLNARNKTVGMLRTNNSALGLRLTRRSCKIGAAHCRRISMRRRDRY